MDINEKLFFAIFGQKDTDDFAVSVKLKLQPIWTLNLFKISFSLYMLVSVIVLINLLVAMMSDTYQRISSQSEIEWKYGLSKLIRNMQKTKTAPVPLNLLTTWITYFYKAFEDYRAKKQRLNVMKGFTSHRESVKRSFSHDIAKTLIANGFKDSIGFSRLRSSPMGSQLSVRNVPTIDIIVDWNLVRRKYGMLFGGEIIKSAEGNSPTVVDVL